MDELELSYESAESIPAEFASLYTERDGAFHLTKIKGMKTQADIDRLNKALNGARTERDTISGEYKPIKEWLGDRKLEDIQSALDEIEELRARAEGKDFPEDKLNELADRRVNTKLAPVQRELEKARNDLAEIAARAEAAEKALETRELHDHLRTIGEKAKLRPEAMADWMSFGERAFERAEDGQFVTRDKIGIAPGITADIALGDLKESRPHWWPDSVGGGASGGKGGAGLAGSQNPWSEAGWSMTRQLEVIKTHGKERAEQMAKAVGSHLGATAPKRKASA